MALINNDEIRDFVEKNIQTFHDKRLEKLRALQLKTVLHRKNPYLFRAKNLTVAADLVKSLLDAFLSSQEEESFGHFLEELAIFVCQRVYGGRKSTLVGIDLEFEREDIYYIVSIKSGPSWGNSDQINRMLSNFDSLITLLQEQHSTIIAVNGCCYGRDTKPYKIGKLKMNRSVVKEIPYYKFCGQEFWSFVSGIDSMYVDIVEPMGYQAKLKNDAFWKAYSQILNRFTIEFSQQFCTADGSIDWEHLVALSSARIPT
ncbi:MAG: cytosolic protein [Chloroflexaceae bacterium]|nr:cytosolic protein [Chloroflexaceae bacterium]